MQIKCDDDENAGDIK